MAIFSFVDDIMNLKKNKQIYLSGSEAQRRPKDPFMSFGLVYLQFDMPL